MSGCTLKVNFLVVYLATSVIHSVLGTVLHQ